MHALSAASAATLSCPSTSSAGSPTSSPSRPSAIVPERQGWLSWLTTDRKIREVFDGLNDLSRQIANPNLQVALIPLGAAWVWLLLLDHLKGTERGLSVEATSTLLDDGRLSEAMEWRQRLFSTQGHKITLYCLRWLDLVTGPLHKLASSSGSSLLKSGSSLLKSGSPSSDSLRSPMSLLMAAPRCFD
ncbi:hypothetical protein DY000_02060012 [Brassica cretica]|uniref:Uncharacterized protein n=1 Tax=Brassica cretica TaxID=69181 RepID=A0ABQ7ASW1_BRACR|nr:hypothetical protein DY000_02060012 [Brassica cretica]